MDAIFRRRSVRKYTSQDVTEEEVARLLRAAMAAPSAGNEQPWQFVVVRQRDTLRAITEFHEYAAMLLEAPVAIVVCGDLRLEKHKGFWVQDCSAAVQNILVEATDMGLGSVWLGVHPRERRVAGLRKLLGLPEEVIPLAVVALGHAGEEKAPADRYEARRVHHEKW
jgi:nitroreductase